MAHRVDAQAVRAPRSGLALLVAAPTIDSPDDRWIDSFTWQPEVADGASSSGIVCAGTAAREPGDQPAAEVFDPWLVWVGERCSTKGWRARDWAGRARRALEAQQSALVAAEFWSGTIGVSAGNAHLAASTAEVLSVAAVSSAVALTWLDAALTRRLANRQGMIHARPELVALWMNEQPVRFDGNTVLSPLGHLVVADAGYTGDGPRPTSEGALQAADSTSQWAYATDIPSFRLSAAEVLPASLTEPGIGQGVDRELNNLTVWAQRIVGIQWDRHAHLACEVAQGALA